MSVCHDLPLVLCVDDDPLVLRSLRRALRDEPLEILTTMKPRLALRWAGEHDVDLLLTDQRMPEMSGTELIERVLRHSPRTACVILTAYAMETVVKPSFLQGVYSLISKPWDEPMLRSEVLQILRDREGDDREDPLAWDE